MEVASAKGRITFRTLSLPGIVSQLHAFKAEYVKALSKNCILLTDIAHGACQLLLVHSNLLL